MIYLKLFLTFFKIGLFTFGGGYAMLPLIQAEVLKNEWMTNTEIMNFVAISESTPGPFAINMATFVGTETGGVFGAVCSTLGVVMPSFIVILIVASVYEKFKKNKVVAGCMTGLRPAAIGLIASAALSLAITALFEDGISVSVFKSVEFYVSAAVCIVMTVLALKKVHPIKIITASAAVGIIAGYALNLPV
ncbi:MAG: chromate transporter [Oscillospiraceae bacterium]|nr:chromate transporter [Oscillospiraceae bacterium]